MRVLAATMNAALRVVTDDVARAAVDGVPDADWHRRRMAESVRAATRVPGRLRC